MRFKDEFNSNVEFDIATIMPKKYPENMKKKNRTKFLCTLKLRICSIQKAIRTANTNDSGTPDLGAPNENVA